MGGGAAYAASKGHSPWLGVLLGLLSAIVLLVAGGVLYTIAAGN